MSRTDNNRPLLLQWGDSTRKGATQHVCGYRSIHPCDLCADSNLQVFRTTRTDHEVQCRRIGFDAGGRRSFGGTGKRVRKEGYRTVRQRDRAALHKARYSRGEDFDLTPVRPDRRTLAWERA